MIRISRSIAAFAFIGSAVLGYHNGASASETKEVTRTVTVYSLQSDNPKLYETVKAICSDKSVKLSDKARAMCSSADLPNTKLTKALRFRNAGVGAEFNTLASQRQ